jgi:hypothetical protein
MPPRFLRQSEASLYEAGRVFMRLAFTNTGLFQGLPLPCRPVFFVKARRAFMRLGESLWGVSHTNTGLFQGLLLPYYHTASFSSLKRVEPLWGGASLYEACLYHYRPFSRLTSTNTGLFQGLPLLIPAFPKACLINHISLSQCFFKAYLYQYRPFSRLAVINTSLSQGLPY